ncbi:hypothetical protein ACJX0J_027958, partial [Zea mays]
FTEYCDSLNSNNLCRLGLFQLSATWIAAHILKYRLPKHPIDAIRINTGKGIRIAAIIIYQQELITWDFFLLKYRLPKHPIDAIRINTGKGIRIAAIIIYQQELLFITTSNNNLRELITT